MAIAKYIDDCPKCQGNLSFEEWVYDGVGMCSCDIVCYECDFKGYISYKAVEWQEIES
jgi:hypothetical protein